MANNIRVILKGGLGNQMFQYAFAKAYAMRTNTKLVLDAESGFRRDAVYKRKFQLDKFQLPADTAISRSYSALYRYEQIMEKLGSVVKSFFTKRFYGSYLKEVDLEFSDSIMQPGNRPGTILINGFWQDERYFKEVAGYIFRDFDVTKFSFPHHDKLAAELADENAVAVCVRMFEEMPDDTKAGVGGLTGLDFYHNACKLMESSGEKKYYVFSTNSTLIRQKLKLGGNVEFITADEGYTDEIETLWLLAHCRKLVIANSSFYWWGAWLAEKKNKQVEIIASTSFFNPASVPERWKKQAAV